MSLLIVLFSLLSYGLFLGTFIYLVIFVSGGMFTEWLPFLAPLKTIDSLHFLVEIDRNMVTISTHF